MFYAADTSDEDSLASGRSTMAGRSAYSCAQPWVTRGLLLDEELNLDDFAEVSEEEQDREDEAHQKAERAMRFKALLKSAPCRACG